MKTCFSLAMAVLVCTAFAACATTTMAAEQSYCKGAHSALLQYGNLKATGTDIQVVLDDNTGVINETTPSDPTPPVWSDLDTYGTQIKMTCYSDDLTSTPLATPPVYLPVGTTRCAVVSDTVSCTANQ